MKVYETLAKNVLPPLVTMASVSTIDGTIQKKKKKMRGSGFVRTGKATTQSFQMKI